MRKPKSMWEFCGELFLFLGALFLLIGLLSQAGIMKIKPSSHGGPYEFLILGRVFLLIGAFSLLVATCKERKKRLLLQTGTSVLGMIVSVKQLPFTRWGTSYPYVVYFTYEYEGVQYKGKSGLFWILPSVKEFDKETVYIDRKIRNTVN